MLSWEKISQSESFSSSLSISLLHGNSYHEMTGCTGLKISLRKHERALIIGQKNLFSIDQTLIKDFLQPVKCAIRALAARLPIKRRGNFDYVNSRIPDIKLPVFIEVHKCTVQ